MDPKYNNKLVSREDINGALRNVLEYFLKQGAPGNIIILSYLRYSEAHQLDVKKELHSSELEGLVTDLISEIQKALRNHREQIFEYIDEVNRNFKLGPYSKD